MEIGDICVDSNDMLREFYNAILDSGKQSFTAKEVKELIEKVICLYL